jgi:TetR/AcrR family transcriptional regulator
LYETFENLPDDRKKKIIEICLDEFSENSYENSSTNTIVKKAGISKGILFHYFVSKKNLYLYILDIAIDNSIKKFYVINKKPATDIFNRLLERAQIKMQLAYEDPRVFKFVTSAFSNVPQELKTDLENRYKKIMEEHLPITFKDIDYSKFRKGVDKNKAIELIVLCLEGLFNKYMNIYKSQGGWDTLKMEAIMKESQEYIEILKKGIYE